jgi:hypothetical protein
MPTGNMAAGLYSPTDIYLGELAGSLESIDAGTTTVIDHAHMNYSVEHNEEAVRGISESGIRGVFCYCANPRVKDWKEFQMEGELVPEWWWEQIRNLAGRQPFAGGRISLGLGWDAFYLPKEMVVKVFEDIRALGIKLITCHHVSTPTLSTPSLIYAAYNRFRSSSTSSRLGSSRTRHSNLPRHRNNPHRNPTYSNPRLSSQQHTQHRTPNVTRKSNLFPPHSPRHFLPWRRLP